ncbi:pheromone A receptor-domain-containing protein [Mycena leptocephala]|nr:pheromone A receptor-domain-containing protein [Mycena leptocephala]
MSKGSTPRTEATRHIERQDGDMLLSIAGLWKHELCRQRYQIASVRTVTKNRAEERSAIHIDLAIALEYIAQGHRYNIFEHIGCLGETYKTPVAVILFHLPPILIGAVLAVYCASNPSATRAPNFFLLSASAHANLNLNRYLRLMAPVSTDLLLLTVPSPPSSYTPTSLSPASARGSPGPDTHSNFSPMVQVPGNYWRAYPYSEASVETLRWAIVACALLFFAYFEFADEAIENYRGRSTRSQGGWAQHPSTTSPPLMAPRAAHPNPPVFIRKETTQKRESFDSSYGGISPLECEDKENALTLGDGDARALTLGDVSGMLPDDKESDYSSPPSSASSASSDTESMGGEEAEIEVSSLHCLSVHIPTTLSLPDLAPVRRASADVPMPVVDAADIV